MGQRYILELEGCISAFNASKPYTVFEEFETKSGNKLVRVKLSGDVPEDVQRLVGLALTDLRSALDFLACQLVILKGRSSSGVEFPISRSVDEFKDALKEGKIKKAGPSVISELRLIEPYKGGKSSGLWALNELRRQGVHRHLTPIGHAANLLGGFLHAGPTGSVSLTIPSWSTPDECPVVLTVSGDKNDYQVNFAVDISITKIDGFESQPILPFLQQSAEFTDHLTAGFEKRFFTPASKL